MVVAMRRLDDIIADLRRLRPSLSQRYPIRGIGVFGSYVRGEQKPGSDLDVLVELDGSVGLIEFVGLKQDLSDAMGIDVDLVAKDALKPRIGRRILAEVVMV